MTEKVEVTLNMVHHDAAGDTLSDATIRLVYPKIDNAAANMVQTGFVRGMLDKIDGWSEAKNAKVPGKP